MRHGFDEPLHKCLHPHVQIGQTSGVTADFCLILVSGHHHLLAILIQTTAFGDPQEDPALGKRDVIPVLQRVRPPRIEHQPIDHL
ncbi:MAG TPA: hypothetical protein PLX70_08090, partial [Solirubrobacterales bacterium]|nr:hypothetical protein [Solirubrobacterales bacterium]